MSIGKPVENKLNLIDLGPLLIACGLIIFLLWSFFFSFDLTDEAIHLYNFKFGNAAVDSHTGFVLFHNLGALFNHHIFFYRSLTLFLIAVSCFSLTFVFEYLFPKQIAKVHLWTVALSAGLIYFANNTPTASYNVFIATFYNLFVTGILVSIFAKNKRHLLYGLCLATVAMTFAFASKPPPGILIALSWLAFIGYFFPKISWRDRVLVLLISVVSIGFVATQFDWKEIFLFVEAMKRSTHSISHLLWVYIKDFFDFFHRKYIPVLVIFFLIAKFFSKKTYIVLNSILILAIIYVLQPLVRDDVSVFSAIRNFEAITLALLSLLIFKIKLNKKEKVFLLAVFLGCIIPAAGTNNTVLIWAANNFAGLWIMILFLVVKLQQIHTLRKLSYFIAVSSLFLILAQKYFDPYRHLPLDTQTQELTWIPELQGIKVDKKLFDFLENFKNSLESAGFNAKTDTLLAVYQLPGLVLASGGRALGTAWYHTGYKGLDDFHCDLLDFYKVSEKRFFIIQNAKISQQLWTCLGKNISFQNTKVKKFKVGKYYDWSEELGDYELTLKGPYIILPRP